MVGSGVIGSGVVGSGVGFGVGARVGSGVGKHSGTFEGQSQYPVLSLNHVPSCDYNSHIMTLQR